MAQIRIIRNDTLTLGEWKKARKEEAQRMKEADEAKKKS
tara:strand:- start:684 stop:800 length:117 start_codon:yes stop_codon:yes gene_type:complete